MLRCAASFDCRLSAVSEPLQRVRSTGGSST